MRYLPLTFILLLASTVPGVAQEAGSGISAEQIFDDTEFRKAELFRQYQADTDRLAAAYDENVRTLRQEDPENYSRKKMLLEKEFKEEKKALLQQFRREQRALEQEASPSAGRAEQTTRQTAPRPRNSIRERLEAARGEAPIIGTRKPAAKPRSGGYVSGSQRDKESRQSKNRKKQISNAMSTLRGRAATMSKGSGN